MDRDGTVSDGLKWARATVFADTVWRALRRLLLGAAAVLFAAALASPWSVEANWPYEVRLIEWGMLNRSGDGGWPQALSVLLALTVVALWCLAASPTERQRGWVAALVNVLGVAGVAGAVLTTLTTKTIYDASDQRFVGPAVVLMTLSLVCSWVCAGCLREEPELTGRAVSGSGPARPPAGP
ncbi:hypothetical protein [Propionibacterium australiense]|uniref:Uncharacterized protein n=1 Tax=Propionibacterium australiense TaxID=119981 RepID=A0A383S6H1_9ACTN|nr:hypothetical protein [Propionibacterium australiense]RLP09000.1 hypothetical protein D9T14_07775 [Propionibacterium australiense]RLP09066.1 hypothetical protein D7U36_07970 [Propionibacterium australiense]SYZ33433.1 Hypothetical protein PROPAUS_1352 [Propionibacterium australiense]VEH91855.1 Uncharacterised protein [Propionibacterium australiense]